MQFVRQSDEGSVLEAARSRVDLLFKDYDNVVVSFSGGKDSTVVFNLCLEAAIKHDRLPLDVVFFDEEAIGWDTEHYVRRVAEIPEVNLLWYCVPLRHRNGAAMNSGYWFPWAEEDRDRWVRPLPPEAITHVDGLDFNLDDHRSSIDDLIPYIIGPEKGRTVCVLGIRAQESLTRLKAVSHAGRLHNWITPPQSHAPWITRAYPVYDWRTEDVWTAPGQLGWDYNRYYDLLEMLGVSHVAQRCAPPYGDEPLRGLDQWQEIYPDLWDKMAERVPGAAAAARYANTELYAAFGPLTLGPGQTPQEYIRELIERHESQEMRIAASKSVRSMIGNHYRKTDDPILLNARHPLTGLSWRTLRKVAQTADLKSRVAANVAPGTKLYEPLKVRYVKEVAELRSAGASWLPAYIPLVDKNEAQ